MSLIYLPILQQNMQIRLSNKEKNQAPINVNNIFGNIESIIPDGSRICIKAVRFSMAFLSRGMIKIKTVKLCLYKPS